MKRSTDPLDRAGGRRRARRRSAWCSRCNSRDRAVGAAPRAGARAGARASTLHDPRRQDDHARPQLQDKTYVVNFFNSWCIPCQQEAPALKAFYAEHKSEPDFAMVGVVIDDDASTIRGYVATQRHHVAGRDRSERQPRRSASARPASPRPT